MIFVSVGTQLPFERLIKAVDAWAKMNEDIRVFAQIGATAYTPEHMESVRNLSPAEYSRFFLSSSLIISHAGMGTIITGLIHSKPLVIMPRRYAFGEHRNEHQLGTADKFGHFDLIDIVHTDAELFSTIDCRLSSCSDPERQAIAVSDRLVDRIRSFIET